MKGDKRKGKLGTVIVRAEAVKHSNFVASFQVIGLNLPNLQRQCLGMCAKILPVSYTWLKASEKNLNFFQPVYQSSVVANTLNPKWPCEKRNIANLCSADEQLPCRIQV